ncbi:FAD binding domain-containing protein [Rhodobacteraceae bacterium D3-12]|nr:FAD binding domain-containing protein [Rhodobacteraceae bacterium D3-12]
MDYHLPQSLEEALGLLAEGGVAPIAGGTDFYPAMGAGGPVASLVDLTRIRGLRGISQDATGGWRIGAATRWSDIVAADLPPAFDGLKAAAREVGSIQIQNAGTVAGNLCNASPAADGVPPLLVLQADVELARAGETRRMPLGEFIKGVRRTALEPGELVVALHIPAIPEGMVGRFSKLGSRKYLVISIAMAAVLVSKDAGGRIDGARVAVGACSPVAQRLPELEAAMIGQLAGDVVVTDAHLSPLSPIDDVRGSAGYRLGAVKELLQRLIGEQA